MANTKKTSSTRRSTVSKTGTRTGVKRRTTRPATTSRPKRKVVDPMMVSPVRARKDEARLTDTAIENDVDFTSEDADDLFLHDEALYNIDDLYDENGNLIMDEADEILHEEEVREARRGGRRNVTRETEKTNSRRNKKVINEEDGDFDMTEEELEEELSRKKKNAKKVSERAEKRAQKRRKKAEKKQKRKTPLGVKILIVFLFLILGAIGFGAYYFFTIYSAANGVLEGNPMDAFLNKKPMQKDEHGRTNILIFGTAEDDEEHGGAMLTDSILIISVDQDKKIASTFSVPRDLWVNYTVAGENSLYCSVGYKGKINATYYCKLEDVNQDKDAAARYFAKKITEVTDVQIQYYVAVDFKVLRDVVNILGGIDVDVHATDERGILDYCMHNLKLDKGMNYNLNGDQVLDLARARNAMGGYGLANSNFDREINQQRIINGIKNKALNIGILADVNKVKGMLESFGENVKSNFTWAEMGTAMDVITGLHGDVQSVDTRSLYSTGHIGAQSVVIPAGANVDSDYSLYNYNRIHLYIREQLDKHTADYEAEQKRAEMEAEAEKKN
ncbi:LCP family protein [Candidatus Saccharibacteria bacterium]|nr:LCP family protein [Candidatus Saccharibacteria bacterium]